MKKYSLFILILFLVSCNENVIEDSFYTNFSANRWISSNAQVFEINVPKEANYSIELHLAHVYDFQFASIPVEVTLLNKEQIITQKSIALIIKNEKGEQLANCTGDLCDLYQIFEKEIRLKNGNYTLKVKNKFPSAYLPNIIGIGIRVKKTGLK